MLNDEQWGELRGEVEKLMNRELDYVELPEERGTQYGKGPDGKERPPQMQNPVRAARGYCSGPMQRRGITIILEPTAGWDLEPYKDV
jgi:hypothetical protein